MSISILLKVAPETASLKMNITADTDIANKPRVDKNQVSRQFSRAAQSYDTAAGLQQEMSSQLIEMLKPHLRQTDIASIVDLGCGTGTSLDEFSKQYPNASLSGIDLSQPMLDIAKERVPDGHFFCCDLDDFKSVKLPSISGFTDLYFSNASFQWCDFQQITVNVSESLNANGLFAFTSFAPKTHQEISLSWSKVDQLPHRIDFLSMDKHIRILEQRGLEVIDSKTELRQIPFDSTESLLKSIKMTGATNAAITRSRGLLSRERYQCFIHELSRLKPLCLSYEVIYVIAKKP